MQQPGLQNRGPASPKHNESEADGVIRQRAYGP